MSEKGSLAEAVFITASGYESMRQAERNDLKSQLQSLLEILELGDVETACIWLRAAIKRLEK